MLKKILFAILIFFIHLNAYAYPIRLIEGQVSQIIDRTIVINEAKFRPSGYAAALPKWLIEGSDVTISYSCNELGDCYYIDVVQPNEPLTIMDKINQELLDFERVFP